MLTLFRRCELLVRIFESEAWVWRTVRADRGRREGVRETGFVGLHPSSNRLDGLDWGSRLLGRTGS